MFKVSENFEGKIKSIAFHTGDCRANIGVMAAGEYTLHTDTRRIMTVVSGKMGVRFATSTEWNTCLQGETFTIEAGSEYAVRVESDTAYFCLDV